ncbi:hypothetical protein UE46_09885 [Listeria weihenstephanensis]|uniref:LicD/FKTN/FKRP nucleotidyltransferase domain-containing protein n=2 Tax=Listeria weihenstephanensis TaxID=1006155 RepID=A0A1S7FV62_9LIST|nr:LicD family protein [Listeria weihenstephanensis]AQY51336.1 hypothetical protein UE46_09885 [Listeria weihenstephanensis]
MLTQIREEQLAILRYFIQICEDNGLTYYLDGGTLAGSQLYKGYLPLDDDIDISMPRSDYETLIKVVSLEHDSTFIVESFRNNYSCHVTFAKIKKRNTSYWEVTTKRMTENFIDIFPLDQVKRREGLKWILRVAFIQNLKGLLFLRQINKDIRFSKKMMLYSTYFIPSLVIHKILYYLMTYQNGKDARFVANFPGMVRSEERASKYEDYFPQIKTTFCEIQVNVPRNSKQILIDIYGDHVQQYVQVKHFEVKRNSSI